MFFSCLISKCSNKLIFIFIWYNLRVSRLFPPVRQPDKHYLLNNPFPLNFSAHSTMLTCNATCQGFIRSLSCPHSDAGIHCTVCGVSTPESPPRLHGRSPLAGPGCHAGEAACFLPWLCRPLQVAESFTLQPWFHQPWEKSLLLHLSKNILELPWSSRGQDSALLMQGTQVHSLVRD